jgi:hypothetical protein
LAAQKDQQAARSIRCRSRVACFPSGDPSAIQPTSGSPCCNPQQFGRKNMQNNDALRTDTVTVVLSALSSLLSNAAGISHEAHQYSLQGERNSAIGTALMLAEMLDDAKGLLAAALIVHRTKHL